MNQLNSEQMLSDIRKTGYHVISNLDIPLQEMVREARSLVETERQNNGLANYSFGDAVTIFEIEILKTSTPKLYEFFASGVLKAVYRELSGFEQGFLSQLYIPHDFETEKGLARNGYLHFDRYWSIKFLLYLTDVDESCEPFSVVPNSHIKGKQLRLEQWKNTSEYEKVLNRIEIDFPELCISKSDLVPFVGEAGTLVAFDSDIFHLGGLLEKDKSRFLARSHSFFRG